MVNPLLGPPHPYGYGLAPPQRTIMSPVPSGAGSVQSIAGLLGYWRCPDGLDQDASAGLSQKPVAWGARYGQAFALAQNASLARHYRSRMRYERNVFVPIQCRIAADIAGSTRNITMAMLWRTRRAWSANAPILDGTSGFHFAFLTTDGTNPGIRMTNSATSPAGVKYDWFDAVQRVASSQSALPVDWSFIAVTIDIAGNIKFYDNDRILTGSGTAGRYEFTKFQIGRTSQAPVEVEYAEIAIWQNTATSSELKRLRERWFQDWRGSPSAPSTSLTITGDSIVAGETYLVNSTSLWEASSISEEIARLDPRLRVFDVSKSSTFVLDGQHYMEHATATHADAKGGKGAHSSEMLQKIHVIQHARNDLSRGDAYATVVTAVTDAITNFRADVSNAIVGVGTVIATVWPGTGYASQALFDQACVDYNAYVLANYVSMGADFVVDWGGQSAFIPSSGGTLYNDTTYYATDKVHPNGSAGKQLMISTLHNAIKAYVK